MRITFLATLALIFTVAGVCEAREKRPRPVSPIFLHGKPQRVKPVFDKPEFDTGARVSPSFDKPIFEKRSGVQRITERSRRIGRKTEKTLYQKSIMETKWTSDSEKDFIPAPVETKADVRVDRGWFRDLRAP